MGELMTRELFQKKLEKLNPFSKIEVLEYQNIKLPVTIKCLECGNILKSDCAEKLMTKVNLCKERHFYSGEQKAEYLGEQYGFKILSWNSEKTRNAKLQCLKCGAIYYRQHTHLIANPDHCPNCNSSAKKQTLTIEAAQQNINKVFGQNEYKILKYQNFHSSILIKHICGFCWTTRYDNFLKSRGCPKCNKNKSKGESTIEAWLAEHQISFVAQQPLLSPYQRYKFDFYLPDYNLAIEYQGEQHYVDKSQIWEPLVKIQERDQNKREYCKAHNIELLEISYLDYKKILNILSSKFND